MESKCCTVQLQRLILLLMSLPLSFTDAFSLDPDTGLIRSLRLLQSFERFNLTMVATDHGRPPLWGTASLQITVIDVNDNRPVFVRPANGTIMHILEVCNGEKTLIIFITKAYCVSIHLFL